MAILLMVMVILEAIIVIVVMMVLRNLQLSLINNYYLWRLRRKCNALRDAYFLGYNKFDFLKLFHINEKNLVAFKNAVIAKLSSLLSILLTSSPSLPFPSFPFSFCPENFLLPLGKEVFP